MKRTIWLIAGLFAGTAFVLSGCGEKQTLAGKYELMEGKVPVSLTLSGNGTYLYCRSGSPCSTGLYRVTHLKQYSGAYIEFSGTSIKQFEGAGATVSYDIFNNPSISFGDPDSTSFRRVSE
jgi:hypothetical protein